MEKEFKLSSENFFDFENDLVCIVSDFKSFTFLTPKWEKILGWTREELNHMMMDQLIHPDDLQGTYKFIERLEAKQKLFEFENRYLSKDKNVIHLRWRIFQDSKIENRYFGIAIDITELRGSNYFLKMSQEQTKLGTWKFNRISGQTTWSDEVFQIYELDKSTPIGLESHADRYDEANWKKLSTAFFDCLEKGTAWDLELEINTSEGHVKWIRSWGFPTIVGNEIVGAEGLVQDLTEKKSEELILKQAVEELDKMQLSINQHCLVARLNSFGYFLDVNQIFENLTGFSLSDLIGVNFSRLTLSPLQAETFKDIMNQLHKGEKWRGEFQLKTKDGRPIWLDMSLTPIMDLVQHRLHEVVCISYDISQKKLTEERFQTILTGINAGIWEWPDISQKEKFWSPKFYEILEYNPELVKPTDDFFKSIVHADDADKVFGGMRDLIEFDRPYLVEFRVLCGSGKYKWIQSMAVALRDASGKPYRVIGSTIDINQKKLMESNLEEEKQKTIHSSKLATLGEMAAGLAHEVNNPLTIIFGYIRILEEEILAHNMDYELLHKHLGLIKIAAERAAKIVNNLKDFARDGSGDPFEDVQASQLISMVLDLCRERSKKNGVALEVLVQNDPIIYCRKIELSQVILNLLFNSFDAVHDLSEKWIKISANKSTRHVEIIITDSGRGLKPEVAEKIFTPFFTTKKLGLGTGLGLSISQRIILNHGGEIFYDASSPHTKFIVKLPLYYESQVK